MGWSMGQRCGVGDKISLFGCGLMGSWASPEFIRANAQAGIHEPDNVCEFWSGVGHELGPKGGHP